ncbi:MAG: hypothetical protein FWF09_00965 [Bacteroidales bacterium]|nr:hypothetical protein [Bacteroidales bacterium]
MESNYQLLLRKLNEFIRRYYSNELLKGAILSVGLAGLFFLIFVLLEYFGTFGTTVRTVFFWTYILLFTAILARWIAVPVFKLFRVGKTLSYEAAARIIGSHFHEVRDVLLNTLQLKSNQETCVSPELIEAGINQKIKQLAPVPFKLAVSYKTAAKYLRYGLPPTLVLILLFMINPSVVTQPVERIVKYNDSFILPPPFRFEIVNPALKAIQSDDFELEVQVIGDVLPAEAYVNWNSMSHRMKMISGDRFSYRFTNIQKEIRFYLSGGGVVGETHVIEVVVKPQLVNFEAIVTYPPYTGLKSESIANNPDLMLPEGTTIQWKFYTQDCNKLIVSDGEQLQQIEPEKGNVFSYQHRLMNDLRMAVVTANASMTNKDTVFITAKPIADAYPMIAIEQRRDSIYDQRLYFRGIIEDDYGFTRLVFHVNGPSGWGFASGTPIEINRGITHQEFFHFCNLSDLGIVAGDEISYYFEVFDNDGIRGPKSTKSQTLYYKAPTLEELEQQTSQSNENIRASFEDAMKAVQDMQEDLDKLRLDLLQKPNLEWEDKKKLEDILNRQQEVEQKMEDIKKENIEKARKEEQYKDIDENLLNKQRELEKLFDKVMSDEMKKMFEEIQKMLDQQLQKDQLQQALEKIKMNNKELSERFDRTLELFKKLDFEKSLREAIEETERLAQEQKELAEQTENATPEEMSALKEQQDQLNERLDQLKEKLQELEDKDKALSRPNGFEAPKDDQKAADKSMKDASQKMNQGKGKSASDSQKSASESLQEMANKMNDFEEQMNHEDLEEDIANLRQILENLLRISFAQEDLIIATQGTKSIDPKYLEIIRQQHSLKDDFSVVEDSLKAIAKRQMMVSSLIYGELKNINMQFEQIFQRMEKRQTGAGTNQQKLMTSVNNLALMLDESIQQMQAQANSQCSSSSCNKKGKKPGKNTGGGTPKNMREMQEQLSQQLEDMQQQMQQGQQQQRSGMSEQLMRSAAQQQAIREMMEEYMKGLQGAESEELGREMRRAIQDMEKNETDIINRNITNETLRRQKEIVTRLLKSEKADLQREEEQRRESTESRNQQYSNPEDFFKGKGKEDGIRETVKTAPAEFKPYYQRKAGDYLYRVD